MHYLQVGHFLQSSAAAYVRGMEARMGDARLVSAVLLGVGLCTMTLCLSLVLSMRELRRALWSITNQRSLVGAGDAAPDLFSLRGDQDPRLSVRHLPRCLLR